jgi:hypothetical protein
MFPLDGNLFPCDVSFNVDEKAEAALVIDPAVSSVVNSVVVGTL